jgi:GT2 family glycosyltransferase
MKRVSVIIVNWNGRSFIGKCLEALRHQNYRNFSVVLVDNASSDGSADFVRTNFPEVQILLQDHNTGFARANNLALKSITTPYAALLNNDAIADPEWLSSLVGALDEHPEAGFAATKMLLCDHPCTIDRVGDAYCRSGTAELRGRGEASCNYHMHEWVFGACAGAALYRMEMLKDIGLFDEDFFLLYEDVDLSFRAQLRGYKCIYVPEAIVYHLCGKTIVPDSPTSIFYSHRNLEWVYLKNMPARLIIRSIVLHIAYDFAAFAYFSLSGNMRSILKAKFSALRNFPTMLRKRRFIQERKIVDDQYLWQIMDSERFVPRITRRFKFIAASNTTMRSFLMLILFRLRRLWEEDQYPN